MSPTSALSAPHSDHVLPTEIFAALLGALERRDHLNEEERLVLRNVPARMRAFKGADALVTEGSRPTESCLIMRGFAARAKFVASGKRQLTGMYISGDFVDLHSFLLKQMDHSVVALGPCQAAFIAHRDLQAITETSPHLTRLFWLSTVIDGAIERERVTSLGRRSASAHLAHLICELAVRLEVVGLLEGGARFELPLTQTDIADIVGLSLVHANRTIQELRALDLIRWERKAMTIRNFERLRTFADFDPTYLNLVNEPR